MANYTYQLTGYAGVDITFTAPTGGVFGDAVPTPDSRGFLWVKNAAAGGTITVAISVPGTSFGLSLPDVSVSIPDGEQRMIGPLVPDLAESLIGGGIAVSITPNVTGVTAAAVKVS
jgi:hypothetical protein